MTNLMRRPLFLGLSFVLVAALGCGGSGPGGPNSTDPSVGVQLIVQRSLPTNGQEVLPDLSDAGEEQDAGKITLTFSERLDPTTVLDPNNAFNGLTSDVNILNAAFERVPGTPTITGARMNILEFIPAGGTLPNGQYTVTVSRDVMNFAGGHLNRGLSDYHSSFTVGPDTHTPVIRSTFPVANQKDVPKTSQILVTFNESLNAATVNSGTFTVVDGGTNPPAQQNGTITLSPDGFSIVFTPDPSNPLPPNATIVVTVSGGTSGITDVVGNPYAGNPPGSNSYQFQFETVKEPPLPNNPRTVSTNPPEGAVYYGTTDGKFGVISEVPYIANYQDQTLWGGSSTTPNPVQYSETQLSVDGRVGNPFEISVDSRFNPTDGHSWIYVSDTENRAVHILASRTSRVIHTWRALPDPHGLSRLNGSMLFVANTGVDSVSVLDVARATPVGTLGAPDILKQLDSVDNRRDLPVGRGPVGLALNPSVGVLFCANSLDDTCSVINPATWKVTTTFQVGASPYDCAATVNYTGIGYFCFITCQGSGSDDGSVALYWNSPNGLQANITGFKNPMGCAFDNNTSAWIANAGSDTISQLQLQVVGGSFASTILPSIVATVTVGKNPVDVTLEPYFTATAGTATSIVSADRGSSQVTFTDPLVPSRPTFSIEIPGVRVVGSYMDQ